MRRLAMTAIAVSAFCAMADANAQQTIVGVWAGSAEGCSDPTDRVQIRPMSLSGTEFSCTFDSVRRSGNVVTWVGVCSDDGTTDRTTVTARLNGSRLVIHYSGGNTTAPLVRCRR